MISTLIQAILGIFIVLILLLVAYMIYNYERLKIIKTSKNIKKKIPLFSGIYEYSVHGEVEYNTFKNSSKMYRDLAPSINQSGGAEYSYNFWLNINKSDLINSNPNGNDIILFFRGSKIQLNYDNNAKNCNLENNNKYILVKNPLIRMNSAGDSIIVEYNTLTNPDAYRIDGDTLIKCDGATWDDKNRGLLGIYNMTSSEYNKKWFMFTLVMREITPENDILNKYKTSCKIYLNGINVLDREVEAPYNGDTDYSLGSAAMKHNKAPLYVNPGNLISSSASPPEIFGDAELSPLKMADLTYFNYAINNNQIKTLFNAGFNKETFKPLEEPGVVLYPIANVSSGTSYNNVKPY